ncbi:MAG: addiction module protein, partial [Longimicrobiaceae bacterium]
QFDGPPFPNCPTPAMTETPAFDFSGLSAAERLDLAERLLHSVGPEQRGWSLTPAQRAELDRGLAEHERDPNEGESWEAVREEISGG